jgi:hypothetical protein
MNKFLFTVALLAASVATFAQNRLVNKAEYAIKENKLDEAQTLLTEALNSGVTKICLKHGICKLKCINANLLKN